MKPMTGVAFSEEPSEVGDARVCDVPYCREKRASGDLFCDKHGEPGAWSHTGLLTDITCNDCGRAFQSPQSYWFHRGWPHELDHKQPGEFEGECLQGFEGPKETHSDGKVRNYSPMKEGTVRLSFGIVRTAPAEPLSDEELDEAVSKAKWHDEELHRRFLVTYGWIEQDT